MRRFWRRAFLHDHGRAAGGIAILISRFLKRRLSHDLHVSDVLAKYRDSENGWDEELRFDEIVSRLADDGQFIKIEIAAEINGTKFTSSGQVQSAFYDKAVRDLPFQFETSIPDDEAENIQTVGQAIEYIAKHSSS